MLARGPPSGLLRQRQCVLEAKNIILDSLVHLQKPLQVLGLHDRARLGAAMDNADKRAAILGLSLSRVTLEDEARKWGVELGPSFEQALRELLSEGRLLKLAGPAGDDVYLLVHRLSHGRYDLTEINRLLHEGTNYAHQLSEREQQERETDRARTYRL